MSNWTQTPEGRAKLSRIRKQYWARVRRDKKQGIVKGKAVRKGLSAGEAAIRAAIGTTGQGKAGGGSGLAYTARVLAYRGGGEGPQLQSSTHTVRSLGGLVDLLIGEFEGQAVHELLLTRKERA